MRNPVRKFVGVALMAVFAALALPLATAGAQTVPGEGPPPTPECIIDTFTPATPVPATSFPVTVTLSGTLSAPATLSLFTSTPPGSAAQLLTKQDFSTGPFSISGQVTGPSTLTLGITFGPDNAYAAACATRAGVSQFTVSAETATKPVVTPAPAAQALAFTGSSDTPTYVLIGIAAIVVGTILVVAARRRRQVS